MSGTARWKEAYVGDDDRSVLLVFTGGSPDLEPGDQCWEGYRGRVEERPEQVVVTTERLTLPSSRGECTDEGFERELRVDLAEPLGDRELLDGTEDPDTGSQGRPVFRE